MLHRPLTVPRPRQCAGWPAGAPERKIYELEAQGLLRELLVLSLWEMGREMGQW
jgi:hypothetical protein